MKPFPKILAVGEVMVELSPQPQDGDGFDRGFNPGFDLGFAGDTFNTAIHLARQGFEVSYLTELGDDRFSTAIMHKGESEGVSMASCIRSAQTLPGLYLIENEANGERKFYYWRENSAARQLFSTQEKLAHAVLTAHECEVIYLSGISLAVMAKTYPDSFWTWIAQLRQADKTIIFDPNFRSRLWPDLNEAQTVYKKMLAHCDVVFPTLDDEMLLWGVDDAQALIAFYHAMGVEHIVLKLPHAEAIAFLRGETQRSRSNFCGEVIDTSGAGDAFNAGYLSSYLNGHSLQSCLDTGHDLAAKIIVVPGALN